MKLAPLAIAASTALLRAAGSSLRGRLHADVENGRMSGVSGDFSESDTGLMRGAIR